MKLLTVSCLALCLVLAYADSESNSVNEPIPEYLPPAKEPETALTKVAEDGYRYKTVRRLKYRHRREVSQEYLPPVTEPSDEYLSPDNTIETKVNDDGYQYKTIRRLKFRARHRRDVSEIAPSANEYLPPVDVELAPEVKTAVDNDGYRYRTVRRLKFRRYRREADEAAVADVVPENEYLPPASVDANAEAADGQEELKPEVKSAELAKDGYRYKTVRRIRYRYRY